MILLSGCGAVIYVIAVRKTVSAVILSYWVRSVFAAGVALVALIGYAIYYVIDGAQHFTEPVRPIRNPYHGVGLGAILPTLDQRFGLPWLSKYGKALDPTENGQYLGIPLLLLAILFVYRFRRNRVILMAAALGAIAYVLSLGVHLGFLRLNGSIPMPFLLLGQVPLINNLLPERLSLYSGLFVAVIIGGGIAEMLRPKINRRIGAHAGGSARIGWEVPAVAGALGILAVICLFPRWPYISVPARVPVFFRSAMVKQIPDGSPVLTYPYPNYPMNQAMTWQSTSHMRFKEMGGYALLRGPNGQATNSPTPLAPTGVQELLTYEELPAVIPDPAISAAQFESELHQYLARYRISAVIVTTGDPTVPNVSTVISLISGALGPPATKGGVDLWMVVTP
jgi:hypothetical protein